MTVHGDCDRRIKKIWLKCQNDRDDKKYGRQDRPTRKIVVENIDWQSVEKLGTGTIMSNNRIKNAPVLNESILLLDPSKNLFQQTARAFLQLVAIAGVCEEVGALL